jgi:drug/metabolite transporter (DMT)-like permease
MFVAALKHMPLANLSSVTQNVPLVVLAVVVPFLVERAGIARIAAVLVGLAGVLLIVKPKPRTISICEFLAISTVVVVDLRDIATKRIVCHIPLLIIALANAIFVYLNGLGFGLAQGFQQVESWWLGLVTMAGFLLTCG